MTEPLKYGLPLAALAMARTGRPVEMLTLDEMQASVDHYVSQTNDPETPICPLKAFMIVHQLLKMCEDAKDLLSAAAMKVAEKYGNNSVVDGAMIKFSDGRTTHKFDHYEPYAAMKAEVKRVEDAMKKDGIIDEETGVLYTSKKSVGSPILSINYIR